ncbi:CDP-glycerol glycerophosphotransferase family protein [Shewanella waksmanii]|uniref:PglD-related sugar-binding protein n=1 Tax=Shewanella waksmanii TaxID=213783 RepID=UPI003734FBD6
MSIGNKPMCNIAIVGAGVFSRNVAKVFSNNCFKLECIIDEFKQGFHLGSPVIKAAELSKKNLYSIDKYIVAISNRTHRSAAIDRIISKGVKIEKVFIIDDDPSIPILHLILTRYLHIALPFFRTIDCSSQYRLERHCFGDSWKKAINSIDPNKQTLAFCFYGRGGGFRRHLIGSIPSLRKHYNIITIMDEEPEDDNLGLPKLYMGPVTAKHFDKMDICLTAHFIECSPNSKPKINVLHTSFDFILDSTWISDRFDSADPHYIYASTRATFDWIKGLINNNKPKNRLCLIPGGYTRLDDNLIHNASYEGPIDSIIYAPTLSLNAVKNHDLTYSTRQGVSIVQTLLNHFPDKKIIFRPHPNDLAMISSGRSDELAQPFISMIELCNAHPRLRLDSKNTFYMDSYNASELMISDTSSTAYTFALSTLRPVVFFSANDKLVKELYASESAFIRDREHIGKVVENTDDMVASIKKMLTNQNFWKSKIRTYRESVCFNLGNSESYLTENIKYIVSGEKNPDWEYFNWDK